MWWYVGTFENMRELVLEIIACGEMTIEDNFFIFSTVGDLGAKTLKYSLNLEKQLKKKRELDYIAPTPREVRFDQTTAELQEILKNADIQIENPMIEAQKKLLQHLLTRMSNLDDLKESLKAVFEKE